MNLPAHGVYYDESILQHTIIKLPAHLKLAGIYCSFYCYSYLIVIVIVIPCPFEKWRGVLKWTQCALYAVYRKPDNNNNN